MEKLSPADLEQKQAGVPAALDTASLIVRNPRLRFKNLIFSYMNTYSGLEFIMIIGFNLGDRCIIFGLFILQL